METFSYDPGVIQIMDSGGGRLAVSGNTYTIRPSGHTLKGQMHHHDDLGSKCAFTCHLSNKTTRKSVLLSIPQIGLMKVSKKRGLSLGMEADIIRTGHDLSTPSDWSRDISGRK